MKITKLMWNKPNPLLKFRDDNKKIDIKKLDIGPDQGHFYKDSDCFEMI